MFQVNQITQPVNVQDIVQSKEFPLVLTVCQVIQGQAIDFLFTEGGLYFRVEGFGAQEGLHFFGGPLTRWFFFRAAKKGEVVLFQRGFCWGVVVDGG